MYDKEFLYSKGDSYRLSEGADASSVELDEVDAKDINLASFRIKDTLNQDIWSKNGIKPRIRLKLLQIADDFWESVAIKFTEPVDVIVTGSIANYNWSSYSDIDLHLVVDFNKIDERHDFIKEFMDAKKNIWNDIHDKLEVAGFNVELYVQDVSETVEATGIYSLYKNKWLRKPDSTVFLSKDVDDDDVRKRSAHFMNAIDGLADIVTLETDSSTLEDTYKRIGELYDSIKTFRKSGLEKDGEFSLGDKVYKVLRRSGYLERLIDLKAKTYDLMMSE